MGKFRRLLAVLQASDDAGMLMNKLHRLTHAQLCDVSLIRVVYEPLADLNSRHVDVTPALKELALSTAHKELCEDVDECVIDVPGVTCAAMWHSKIWEGTVSAASAQGAELIIKPADTDRRVAHFHTPDDWNLLRHASVPVLLAQPRAWLPVPTVVAAIDVYDPDHASLNGRILAAAHDISLQVGGRLHLVSIFPVLSKWLTEITSVQSYVKLRADVEEEIASALEQLASQHGLETYQAHALEGEPVDAISALTKHLRADVLVLGTKARQGLSGAVMGNTSETLLQALDCDVITVP